MIKKKKAGLEAKQQRAGYWFVLPFVLGSLFFFLVPLIQTLVYSFCEVNVTSDGIVCEFVGLKNYIYILTEDPYYLNFFPATFGQLAYSLPVIVSLSLILALLLNQKFYGRTAMRAIFFLPLIMSSAGILMAVRSSSFVGSVSASASMEQQGLELIDFTGILASLNIPTQINSVISFILNNVINLIWNCSVQTILFLAGLQNISSSAYEAAKIEGANAWVSFWKITVPMLGNIISLVIVYTMICSFIGGADGSMNLIVYFSNTYSNRQMYDISSASLWFYFIFIIGIIGGVLLLYRKFLLKKWE